MAVLAFLFQDWVREKFKEFFEINIISYRDDIDLQNLIDSLQKIVSHHLFNLIYFSLVPQEEAFSLRILNDRLSISFMRSVSVWVL